MALPCLLAYLFCLPYLPALPFGPCLLAYPIPPALQTYWIRHSCLPFLASLSASLLPCLYTCSICVASPVALSAFPASLHYVTSLFAHPTTCLTYLPGLCALPALLAMLCLPALSASSTLHCPPHPSALSTCLYFVPCIQISSEVSPQPLTQVMCSCHEANPSSLTHCSC
jgi:hypothetical protein